MKKVKIDRGSCKFCRIVVPYGAKVKPGYCSQACIQKEKREQEKRTRPDSIPGAAWLQLNDGIFALVDEIDFERIDAYVWRIDTNRKRAVHTKIRGVDISLHHFVLNVVGQLVDHRNGNALDNRRNNLRFATPTQNNGNRVKSIKNKMSRFKGVSLRPYGRWEATFRRKYVGSFSTEEEAAAAYDKLAREVHGEFACVNFPSAGERSAVASVTVLEQNITHDS